LLLRRKLFGVTDHFAVLGLPRAPWVDADALKELFHRLSAQHHPDSAGGSTVAFTELNTAWRTLRDPAQCLRHYLELAHPATLTATDQTPGELADLFMEIAAFRQDAQRFAGKFASASSPLTKAMLEPERVALRTRLATLIANVEARTEQDIATLRSGAAQPEHLAKLLASLAFLSKWTAQLAEMRLSL
jgi:hypothetical protein